MGATTEETLSPTRLLNSRRRVSRVVITDMRRCGRAAMALRRVRCCADQTVLTASTLRAVHTAEQNPRISTGPETGTEAPVFPLKRIHTTTVLCTAPTLTRTPTNRTQHTTLQTTGQSTSVLQGRSTTTIAEQKCHSGRSPKNGWRENRDKRRQLRWQQQQRWSIASLKTGTTDVK